ncbi:MAG: DNA polymerase III subunit epsilon [Proteobacteria bacterium]|nr:DNA polymerase III subunit epsilon [Pseudomonadota bacterium]
MREIALDTETTGLDPRSGHKMIEIGCVEMHGKIKTGKFFHCYLNPGREVPLEATAVHGIKTEDLLDKPTFLEKADEFLAFIGDAPLVIHNAAFDMKFINHELKSIGKAELPMHTVVDTLLIARGKFPGAPASLDALCKRFNIDLSSRTKHGALLDAGLLADIYLELMGGSQQGLNLAPENKSTADAVNQAMAAVLAPRTYTVPEDERATHEAFLKRVKNPLWTA